MGSSLLEHKPGCPTSYWCPKFSVSFPDSFFWSKSLILDWLQVSSSISTLSGYNDLSLLAINTVLRPIAPIVRTLAYTSPWNHRLWMSIWLLTSLLGCLLGILSLTRSKASCWSSLSPSLTHPCKSKTKQEKQKTLLLQQSWNSLSTHFLFLNWNDLDNT